MKIAPVLLGAIAAQESGDYSDYDAAPAAGEERWDSWGNDNNFLMASNDSGRGYTAKTVLAVTCWESNNMGDLRHYNTQNDDGFGWGNIHHGHDQAADSNIVTGDESDYQVGTYYMDQAATPNKVDLHSAMAFDNRYSGCIYEVGGWTYDANSYNRWWLVQYGADANGAFAATSGLDRSNADTIRVNWWHYFNAHVLVANTGTAGSTQSHKIAMANPQYEGLGYLNFICTFAKADTAAVAGTSANDVYNTNRATKNFNVFDTVTDNYSGGYAFSVGAGDSSSEEWYSAWTSGSTWTANYAAVSSFPHNDLGKDFRFNVRILHKGGDGDPLDATGKDSYYFYRVNRIDIDFPYDVRCPRETNNVTADAGRNGASGTPTAGETFRCMDSANYNGHRGYSDKTTNPQSSNDDKENVAFYVENLANFGGSAGFCTTALSDGEWYQCGKNYHVEGLMNTYDEHAQQEFGTHQEFWFQFYYHFELANADSNPQAITVGTHVSKVPFNYPNILFNSFELTAVTFACSVTNVYNNNVCT